jgi:hypothetical protein
MDTSLELPVGIDVWFKAQDIVPETIERIVGGGINRLFRVDTPKEEYLLKVYGSDLDSRRFREVAALTFLPKHGFDEVPRVVAFNREKGYALYTFVNGNKVRQEDLTSEQMIKIADFVLKLQAIKPSNVDMEILNAHRACFSTQDYIDNFKFRLEAFEESVESGTNQELKDFNNKYKLSQIVMEQAQKLSSKLNNGEINKQILPEDRRLSPMDLGVHNMLFDNDKIWFLDFEKFGWDDPRKMAAEFINHDRSTEISDENKKVFLDYYKSNWDIPPALQADFDSFFKLSDLDWLTIVAYASTDKKVKVRNYAIENFDVDEYLHGRVIKMISRIEKILNEG